MVKLPIINKGITFNEIPNRVAVFFEIGQCKQNCKNCHSELFMKTRLAKDLWTSLEDMVSYVELQKKHGANAIVIMGGTNNEGVGLHHLVQVIDALSGILPVGLYSGIPDNTFIHRLLKSDKVLTWLKTGEYIDELGGLTEPKTNQKFYELKDGKYVEQIISKV